MWIYIWEDEIKEIFVWEWMDSYEAMRWPCPEGFHVPTNTEWTWLRTIMVWLSLSSWNNFKINLHLPFAWHLRQGDWTLPADDNKGYYFASTTSWTGAYRMYLTSSSSTATGTWSRASGYSVRAFKDTFEVPNSNWTVINGTLWSAGIFRNQTDWIISITSDWSTGYTIMDKNLWATTVYSNWDTLSQANCGYFFQRWNNNWFPRTWATTTSSTAIDTTGYWPWNYYNNGTFITITWDWSSPSNDNLRWWTTWITKKWNVIEVYVGTTKIRPVSPTPPAEFTDRSREMIDLATSAFTMWGTDAAVQYLYWDAFLELLDWYLDYQLYDYNYDAIWNKPDWMHLYTWYWFEITDWWDMTDIIVEPETAWWSDWICIVADFDDMEDSAQYVQWTDLWNDTFSFNMSSYASSYVGKDTVLLFIFK